MIMQEGGDPLYIIMRYFGGSPGSYGVWCPRSRAGGRRPLGTKGREQQIHILCPGLIIHQLCDLMRGT